MKMANRRLRVVDPATLPVEVEVHAPIEPSIWGRDHLTTLLYLETRCVDHMGTIDRRHMRCDPKRHPLFAHEGSIGGVSPTRLACGEQYHHDDWDCLDDIIAAGYMENLGTGANPIVKLTDLGWTEAGKLRRQRAERALTRERRE